MVGGRIQRMTLAFFGAVLGVGGLVLAVAGSWWGAALVVGGLAWLLVAIYSLTSVRASRSWGVALGLALVPVAGFGVVENAIKPTFDRAATTEIAGRLVQAEPEDSIVHVLISQPSYASQLRLLTGGRLRFVGSSATPSELAAAGVGLVLIEDSQMEGWAETGYRFEPIGFEPHDWRVTDLLGVWQGTDVQTAIDERRLTYYLADDPSQRRSRPRGFSKRRRPRRNRSTAIGGLHGFRPPLAASAVARPRNHPNRRVTVPRP